MTVLAHQICLSPTLAQAQSFCSFAGCHRVVYNFALDSMRSWWTEYERSGRTIDKPNFPELKRTFNQLRRELFPWMNDPKAAHRDCWSQPFADLKKAYQAWWKGSAKAPAFKSKRSAPSFYVANDRLIFDGKKVRLPKVGWVRTGGLEHQGDAEDDPGTLGLGCGDGGDPSSAPLQGGAVRRRGEDLGPLVSVHQAVLSLWRSEE